MVHLNMGQSSLCFAWGVSLAEWKKFFWRKSCHDLGQDAKFFHGVKNVKLLGSSAFLLLLFPFSPFCVNGSVFLFLCPFLFLLEGFVLATCNYDSSVSIQPQHIFQPDRWPAVNKGTHWVTGKPKSKMSISSPTFIEECSLLTIVLKKPRTALSTVVGQVDLIGELNCTTPSPHPRHPTPHTLTHPIATPPLQGFLTEDAEQLSQTRRVVNEIIDRPWLNSVLDRLTDWDWLIDWWND